MSISISVSRSILKIYIFDLANFQQIAYKHLSSMQRGKHKRTHIPHTHTHVHTQAQQHANLYAGSLIYFCLLMLSYYLRRLAASMFMSI